MKRLILLPLIAVTLALAACGSSSNNSSSGSAKTPAASGGSKSGHTTITVWQGDTEVEAAGFKKLVAEFNRTHPSITVELAVLRQQRLRAAEGAGRHRRRQAAGHLLPVRLLGAQHRHQPAAGAAQQVHRRRPQLQLERLLPRRAQGGHRRQQHHRDPRAGRQPRPGLQQDAVQAGRHPPAHGHLDLERLRERRRQAHQRGQEAVRLGLRQRRQRGHRLALLGDAVAGGRLDPQPRRQAGGLRLRRRHQGADPAPAAHRAPLDLPRRRLGQLPAACSTTATSACSGPAPGTSPRSSQSKVELRRHHPARRSEPPDDLRPRQLGDVQQRRRPRAGGVDVPEVADLARRSTCSG